VIPPIDIKKSLISSTKRIGADHIHPHRFRHTYPTRLTDQGVPMEHIMTFGGWRSSAMTKRNEHANEDRYGAASEALDAAGKAGSAEALAAARCK
jgi:integrase